MKISKKKSIAGIDMSKKTFDIAVSLNELNAEVSKAKFLNTIAGFEKCGNWLKKLGVSFGDLLVCLENTGIYHRGLVGYLLTKNALVWVQTPVQIKWSMGIQRGKSDSIDSERILTYCFRNQDKAKKYEKMDESLQQISDNLALRIRLQNCISSLKVPIKELKNVGLVKASKQLEKASQKSIKALQADLKLLDQKILQIIKKDKELSKQYDFASSVKSIGFVATVHIMVHTNGFKRFKSAKQFASYAGVAPFEYSSGTSIRGRTKVHPMADKTMKTILHMCAVSSVRHSPEMKKYFARKVGEGKNKMLVLNAIRNKLVGRVFSCVKNQRMYQEDFPVKAC